MCVCVCVHHPQETQAYEAYINSQFALHSHAAPAVAITPVTANTATIAGLQRRALHRTASPAATASPNHTTTHGHVPIGPASSTSIDPVTVSRAVRMPDACSSPLPREVSPAAAAAADTSPPSSRPVLTRQVSTSQCTICLYPLETFEDGQDVVTIVTLPCFAKHEFHEGA